MLQSSYCRVWLGRKKDGLLSLKQIVDLYFSILYFAILFCIFTNTVLHWQLYAYFGIALYFYVTMKPLGFNVTINIHSQAIMNSIISTFYRDVTRTQRDSYSTHFTCQSSSFFILFLFLVMCARLR